MRFSDVDSPLKCRRVIGYVAGSTVVRFWHNVVQVSGPLYLGMTQSNGEITHVLFLFFNEMCDGLKIGSISLEENVEAYIQNHVEGRCDTIENFIALMRRKMDARQPVDVETVEFIRQFSPEMADELSQYLYLLSMPQRYSVELEDCSMPAICDGTTLYYGTQKDILALLACDKEQPELLEVAQDYFSGKGDGVFKILWTPIQFLNPVENLGEREIILPQPFKHSHINIWGFPYEMRADRAVVALLYLRGKDGDYLRAAKVRFHRLQYGGLREEYMDIQADNSWGYPGMITEEEGGWITNRLLYVERRFDSREDMEKDMENPDQEINLAGFFNEIFGDG